MEIRKHYGTPLRVQFTPVGESRTHQGSKDECDINRIMRRFEKTGVIEHQNRFQGRYGDFTLFPGDYQEALHQVRDANEMFLTLPAKVRKEFDNDPGQFLDFVTDPSNSDALKELGLTNEAPTPPSDLIEASTPQPKAKAAPAAKNEPSEGE